jgi:hypothetical protein
VADRREGHGVYEWPDGAKYEGYFKDGQHDGQGTYRVSVVEVFVYHYFLLWYTHHFLFPSSFRSFTVCRWFGIHRFLEAGSLPREWVRTVGTERLDCLSDIFGRSHSVFPLSFFAIVACSRSCTWSDGRVYSGMWSGGQAHGQGKETNPDGTIRHDGEWQHDSPLRLS